MLHYVVYCLHASIVHNSLGTCNLQYNHSANRQTIIIIITNAAPAIARHAVTVQSLSELLPAQQLPRH